MKTLTLFYLESCPYCRRALAYMKELTAENPKYAEIPVNMIEERQQKQLAASFDYYYVPCYFIENEKIAEGRIDKAGVQAVFERCLEI